MKKIYIFFAFFLFLNALCFAQVKSNYIYSTTMPYGTLDLRTKITATNYFYIQEDKSFSYRESSPGVKTDSYFDMTSWDSSPFKQGNLRRKNGTLDQLVMNYRLLPPLNYNATYAEGYPIILLLHGAVERGNCYYNACYHSNFSYDPNVNNPPAPKTATSKLLNNDHHLTQGGTTYLDGRNKAAGKLPNDPTLIARAFPGFVLAPQMLNIWDSLNVQDAIRLVQLIAQKYNIDENRIYVDGLSIGGYAVYEAIKRASWLFAAAQPMSAVKDASIFKYNQQGKVAHIPIWVFQGGTDTNPSPAYTNKLVNDLRNAGSIIRYSLYPTTGHTCWYKAFAEPEFFSWLLTKSKSNIHPFKGMTEIKASTAQYPKLMLAEGFFAYQWERDGVLITGASANSYIAKIAGVYRARFSRVAAPTATQWNKWSPPITITVATNAASSGNVTIYDSLSLVGTGNENTLEVEVFPNPASRENLSVKVVSSNEELPIELKLIDMIGRPIYSKTYDPKYLKDGVQIPIAMPFTQGIYIIIANQGSRSIKQKVFIRN